jgi:heat-inducible transcriptional repressor
VDGTHYLFEQPEFRDISKSKRLLKTFEEKTALIRFAQENLSAGGSRIYIGRENPCEEIQDCSVVMSSYGVDDNTLGVVGVIGPTRMSYKRVVPVVDSIASQMTSAFEAM